MTEQAASYRRILRSSSIIGGASVINIVIGLVRTKVLAVLLGPAGVGLVGLYGGLMSTATGLASMGLGIVGTRQIAEAVGVEDARALAVARRAIFLGTLLLACAGALVVWVLREPLALHVLGSSEHAGIVGWLALGVAISVAAGSQAALLQGMRRIGDMARLNVFGTALNTALGIALLWQWGDAGLVAYVLVGPLASLLLGHVYVARLPKSLAGNIPLSEVTRQWKELLRLGLPFMGAGVAASLVQLFVRVEISSVLGTDALGHYQAASLISMQYIGFVLVSMGADYYPRLASVIHDNKASIDLVNDQTEIALLLSAPALIAMMALAPWVIQLIYTGAFAPAVEVLRWQVLGDVFKLASWPLAFVILAAGDGKTYFWTEILAMFVGAAVIAGLVAAVGLQITGVAYLAGYVVHLPIVYVLARQRIQFQWSNAVTRLLVIILSVCLGVGALASVIQWLGASIGCLLALAFGLYAVRRLSQLSSLPRPLERLGAIAIRFISKLESRHN